MHRKNWRYRSRSFICEKRLTDCKAHYEKCEYYNIKSSRGIRKCNKLMCEIWYVPVQKVENNWKQAKVRHQYMWHKKIHKDSLAKVAQQTGISFICKL